MAQSIEQQIKDAEAGIALHKEHRAFRQRQADAFDASIAELESELAALRAQQAREQAEAAKTPGSEFAEGHVWEPAGAPGEIGFGAKRSGDSDLICFTLPANKSNRQPCTIDDYRRVVAWIYDTALAERPTPAEIAKARNDALEEAAKKFDSMLFHASAVVVRDLKSPASPIEQPAQV